MGGLASVARTLIAVAVGAALAGPIAAAEIDFNGEVLLAPSPGGWTVAADHRDAETIVRTYERPYQGDRSWTETMTFTTRLGGANRTMDEVEEAFVARYREICEEVDAQPTEPVPSSDYESAIMSLLCLKPTTDGRGTPPPATARSLEAAFVMAKVLRGDHNLYMVERTWRGAADAPALPTNSPRTQSMWMSYFTAVRVCNTLTESCDPRIERSPYSNPRFGRMREALVAAKPVVDFVLVMEGAQKIGRLTGQAELCGEDVSAFLGKVERMFEYVTGSAEDQEAAVETFRKALTSGRNTPVEQAPSCTDTLQEFRLHPTRPGRFPNHLQRFAG